MRTLVAASALLGLGLSGCSGSSVAASPPSQLAPSVSAASAVRPMVTHSWVWNTVKISPQSSKTIKAKCPNGTYLIGGGYKEDERNAIARSAPDAGFDAWAVEAYGGNTGSGNSVTVYASCQSN